ncbi:MAG: peptidase S8/S53 domain-containing protein [Linnemannia gamsii]|nr:MAG: peptidase S8/S53 domain-containing protein [Linnemannia gamsii]
MRVPHFILSTTIVTLAVLTLTPPAPATAQQISQILNRVKIISDGGTTVGGYKHHQQQFQEPIIRSAEMVENRLQNAYWIDFHDQFDQHAQFSQLVANHPGITLRHEFWDSINAVSVSVRDEGVLKEILAQIAGIKMIEPVVMHERPDALNHGSHAFGGASVTKKHDVHELTGVKEVHDSLKLYGKGIKIGIIDSGIDYHHPALGGCFGPGCKVAYGTDFVGDDGRSPDDDPMTDCDGHGTHVAGIIAANDIDFIGVIPQATLGAYRVFGCQGGTSNDLIMKALLRAARDGMQVINLSLGGPGGWRQDREARLADELAKNGTIIVAAMGNEGQMGLFEASSPGVAGSAITVASTENEFRSNMYFTVDEKSLKAVHVDDEDEEDENRSHDYDDDSGDDNEEEEDRVKAKEKPEDKKPPRAILYLGDVDMNFSNTTLVAVSPGTSGKIASDACKPITQDLTGKIALVRRGDCTFKIKISNVALAHASGIILMDNVPSTGFAADTEGALIKVHTITLDDGEYLLKTIQQQKKEKEGIKLVSGKGPKQVFNPNSGFLSSFSSMGPDSELNSKPDIAAPGGQIWSTFPIKLGSYASLSGTSMATPYIVGCVGLYLEGLPNGDHSAKAIKTAFQNSAQPRKQQKGYKGYASVTQQGAGLLSMMDILSTKAVVTPSHISLNDTEHINSKQQITVVNTGTTQLEYNVDIVSAAGLEPFDKKMMVEKNPLPIEAKASVKVSQKTVTVAPGSSSTIDLQFTGPSTDPTKFVIYSGYVRLTPAEVSPQTPVMHIPYMGMQGDFKKVDILDSAFGLRLFDARGRPIRLSPTGSAGGATGGHPTVGVDGASAIPVEVSGTISGEIGAGLNTGIGEAEGDAASGGRPRPVANGMKIVFRMVTASEILVLDLVSAEGEDPYQVKSFGLLKGGIARFVPRNDQLEGNAFQVMGWDGELLREDGTTESLMQGSNSRVEKTFRLRISLLKHFGNPDNDLDFEAHMSEPFSLG